MCFKAHKRCVVMPKRVTRSSLNEAAVVVLYDQENEMKQHDAAATKKNRRRSKLNFFPAKDKETVDPATVAEVKQETADDIDSLSICQWIPNLRKCKYTCDKVFESPRLLLEHLIKDHKRSGSPNKFHYCRWKNCSAWRSKQCFRSHSSFEDHLRPHTECTKMPALYFGDGAYSIDSTNDKNQEIDDSDVDVIYIPADTSDDSDYSPDTKIKSPKKRKRKASLPAKTPAKKICSKITSLAVLQKSPSELQPSSGHPRIITSKLTEYKFICQWEVHLQITLSNSKQVTCTRKYSNYNETIQHLEGHHLSTMLKKKMQWKCYWKNCELGSKVFESVDELAKHIRIHAEYVSPDSFVVADAIKRVAIANESPKTETIEPSLPRCIWQNDGKSWMSATLQAFVSLPFQNEVGQPCAIFKLCTLCRLKSLKYRIDNTAKCGEVFIPYEFTKCMHDNRWNLEDGKDFIIKLLDALAADEKKNHNNYVFKDKFWFSCLWMPKQRCPMHQIGKEIDKYFLHNTCTRCCAYFPFNTQENLIFRIQEGMVYFENLVIQGRLFELRAVVAQDMRQQHEFYACCKLKGVWTCYRHSSANTVTIANILGNPKVCVLMYSLKSEAGTNVTASEHFYKYEDIIKNCAEPLVEAVAEKAIVLKREHEPVTNESKPAGDIKVVPENKIALKREHELVTNESKPAEDIATHCPEPLVEAVAENKIVLKREYGPVTNESKPAEGKFEILRRFTNRCFTNIDHCNSCINAVLQSLIQTQLCNVEGKLCNGATNCYYCRMVSLVRRFMANDHAVTAYDFTLSRSVFDMSEHKEGDPAVYISDLLNEIISSERVNHTSSIAKRKFMVRFQKKSCACGSNFKVYHWPVCPEKRNVSLDDLMAKLETLCTKCNKMTDLEPVYMPENLVITISNDKSNADASVHYPVEWTFQGVRYFLSSVIVSDEKSRHYFTCCKIFDKWKCYDDTKVTEGSVFDIQGKVRVLVYVTRELTADFLKYSWDTPKRFYRLTDGDCLL